MSIFDEMDFGGGTDGMPGPYMSWQAFNARRGSRQGGHFYLRTKDEASGQYVEEDATALMQGGFIFDFESARAGWEKGEMGEKTERVWAPGLSLKTFPRPTQEMRSADGRQVFAWKPLFGVRIGLGDKRLVSWTQAQFSALAAFEGMMKELSARPEARQGKLPVLKMTGAAPVRNVQDTNAPVFEIVKFVDRPDWMVENSPVPAVDLGATEVPGATPAAQTPPPAAAPASGVDSYGF